jgi:hypothetical protein
MLETAEAPDRFEHAGYRAAGQPLPNAPKATIRTGIERMEV